MREQSKFARWVLEQRCISEASRTVYQCWSVGRLVGRLPRPADGKWAARKAPKIAALSFVALPSRYIDLIICVLYIVTAEMKTTMPDEIKRLAMLLLKNSVWTINATSNTIPVLRQRADRTPWDGRVGKCR